MHAANPALAIEQATTITLVSSLSFRITPPLAARLTSHLRLTPALRSRYRAPALEQHPHRRGREQERHHALLRVIAHKLSPSSTSAPLAARRPRKMDEPKRGRAHLDDVLEHGGYDARRAVRGARHDPPAARVHLVHRDRVAREEVHRRDVRLPLSTPTPSQISSPVDWR